MTRLQFLWYAKRVLLRQNYNLFSSFPRFYTFFFRLCHFFCLNGANSISKPYSKFHFQKALIWLN